MDETKVKELGESLEGIASAAIQEAKEKGNVTREALEPIHREKVVGLIRDSDINVKPWRVDCYLGHIYDALPSMLSEEDMQKIMENAGLYKTYLLVGMVPRPKPHYAES